MPSHVLTEVPYQILKSFPNGGHSFPHVLNTCGKPWKKKPTHNKELNEESDLCIGKLNSCFDNSCYKKFADKTAWILTFPIS